MAAESVVSSVVGQLGNLLNQEVNFLSGLSGQVEQMQRELKLMQSYLEDADKRQDENRTLQAWVSEIREAACDAEAVIETYYLEVASRRRGGIRNAFKRYACILDEAKEIHNVGSEIEAIKTRISNLRSSLQNYGITSKIEKEASSSSSAPQQKLMRSYSHVVEEHTIGWDEDVKFLVEQLVNEEKHYPIISICGMGGQGKTSLAKEIYHHTDIRHHFDGFAWASVSRQCRRRDVWEGILFKLISPTTEQREEIVRLRDDEVAKKLHDVQLKKRCLVILDDIWRLNTWNRLSPAFPLGKAGSKILLTTRNKEVAQRIDSRGFLHELQCLNEEKSWELLRRKAFIGNDDQGFNIPKPLEELGREMVGRCKGLPLAIVVLGGILATRHTIYEWHMVHRNINWHLGSSNDHHQQHLGVSKVLAFSYHELPYRLKQCFLHFGYFPENFNIPTKKLVRIWVAEGIVSSPTEVNVQGVISLEDVAEHYLNELIHRCMVQVVERGPSGMVKTCRIHNLMRDFCLLQANQENYVKILQLQNRNEEVDSHSSTATIANLTHRVHRLAVHLGENQMEHFPKQERTPYLQSLLFFTTSNSFPRIWLKMKSELGDFQLLKILDFENCVISGMLPRAIGDLVHLRYLSLNSRWITYVPSSIGNLRFLETLILRDAFGKTTSLLPNEGVRVPNVIWKMKRLRHLYLPTSIKKIRFNGKLRLGDLSDLQTLQFVDTRICDVKELIKLTDLRNLRISYLESIKELEKSLISQSVTFNCLFSLKITVNSTVEETELQKLLSCCPFLYNLFLKGQIEKLPKYRAYLMKLTLDDSQLKEDPMATLEKLPNLSILRLCRNSFMGKKMVCSSNGFTQLKSLVLWSIPCLEEWEVAKEAMPSLCKLVIQDCSELKMVSDGLRFITTLRELEIADMPEAFRKRVRAVNGEGGEDSYKVRHVPSITFKGSNLD